MRACRDAAAGGIRVDRCERCAVTRRRRRARLARAFWPGPLSLFSTRPPAIAAAVHGGAGTVAIRVPAHRVAQALATALRQPITATSANRSGAAAVPPVPALGALARRPARVSSSTAAPRPAARRRRSSTRARAPPALVREGAIPWSRVLESLKNEHAQAARSRRAAARARRTRRSVTTRASRHADPDIVLDELGGLARAAGADVVLRVVQERADAGSGHAHRQRAKPSMLARACDECRRRRSSSSTTNSRRRRPATSRRSAAARHRSHGADPRHLRAPRADARRAAAGRARATASTCCRAWPGRATRAVAAWRRHRHARARAKPSSRPTAGASASHRRCSRRTSPKCSAAAATCARGGAGRTCRPSRSSGTRTPARPRCSTG